MSPYLNIELKKAENKPVNTCIVHCKYSFSCKSSNLQKRKLKSYDIGNTTGQSFFQIKTFISYAFYYVVAVFEKTAEKSIWSEQ